MVLWLKFKKKTTGVMRIPTAAVDPNFILFPDCLTLASEIQNHSFPS